MYRKLLGLVCLLLLGLATSKADTITDHGSTFSLTYTSTSNPRAFNVFLTVNTVGFTGHQSDLLNSIALQLAPDSSDISSVSLLSGPSHFGSTAKGEDVGNNGCTNAHGDGFFCSESSNYGLPVGDPGDVYNFQWLLTLNSPGDLLTGRHDATVQALYVDDRGHHDLITSDCITLSDPPPVVATPEPSSLLLLGTGLAGLAGIIRRKMTA